MSSILPRWVQIVGTASPDTKIFGTTQESNKAVLANACLCVGCENYTAYDVRHGGASDDAFQCEAL